MPAICWHMVTAREAVLPTKDPNLEENLGCLLLGATAPDIRVITGSSREDTHFYDLSQTDAESGVVRFFEAHASLARKEALSFPLRAFVAGYLTHLAVDELWINEMYRPFFGKGSLLEDEPMANIMDRLIQFEMDRRERLERGKMAELYAVVSQSELGDTSNFLDPIVLQRWREAVCDMISQEPSWETLRRYAERHFGAGQRLTEEQVDALMAQIPSLLERATSVVTTKSIANFRAGAVARSKAVVEEYLDIESN